MRRRGNVFGVTMATVVCVLAGVPSASVADKQDPLVSVRVAGKPELWFSEGPRVNVHQSTRCVPTMIFGADPAPDCDLESWTFDQLGGPSAQSELGTITYSAAEVAMPGDTAPVTHLGACLLDPGEEPTVAEAIAYLRAVGCKPGRVVTEPSPPSVTPATAPGEVYRLAAPGGVRARIAPLGTVVDIFVNP
jgi:hypothetical protein